MIVSSTLLEFAWLVIDGFMDANCLAPLIEKGNWVPQKRISPQNLTFSQPLATRFEKVFWSTTKKLWVREIYTMENKDTDYQKVVRVGDQNWEIVGITIRIIFFVWDLYSSPTWKNQPLPKVSIPIQNPNLT